MGVGLAAFTMLFLFALWHYLDRPVNLRVIYCGIAMGLMLCTKFSAVFMLPVAAILMTAAADSSPKSPRSYRSLALAFVVMVAIAMLVIQAAYLSPGGIFLYSTGFARVNADHNPDYLVFLGGQLAHHFTGYFAAAYLLKEPLAAIILALAGLFALRGNASTRVKLFLLLPPAVLFAAHTVFADNLGMRYIKRNHPIHIHGFSPSEIVFFSERFSLTVPEVIRELHAAVPLDSRRRRDPYRRGPPAWPPRRR
jgi:4-amino-4-deoxy-L-arabinose transferase-like glycosyltransferase